MTHVLLVTGLVAGGVGRHVVQLTAGLTDLGHRVRVACPAVVAARFDLAAAGAEVVPVEVGSRPAPVRDRAAVAALRAAARDVDIVHAHGWRAGALALLARGDEPVPPVVVTAHNAAPEGRLASVVHRGLERMVCGRANLVLGVSADLVARAEEVGAHAVDRAVVAAARAEPSATREQVREALGVAAGCSLVVSVGRLAPQKGYDRLLEAIGGAGPCADELHVVLAGEGPQRRALLRQVERNGLPVTLLGHRSDVPDLLGAADLVVSSARWEGQPVWLQEALSVGAPIVATDVGGTAEVLGEGAVLVPGDDPAALGTAIAEVLGSPRRLQRLREVSRRRAADLPTAADAVQAALAAYRRAAAPTTPTVS